MSKKLYKYTLFVSVASGVVFGVFWFSSFASHFFKDKALNSYFFKPSDGVYSDYYDSGELRSVKTYRDGKKHGSFVEFNVEGDTLLYKLFEKDTLIVERWFSESGEIVFQDEFDGVNGVKRKVFNDSLYLYEYRLIAVGREKFESFCSRCHVFQIEKWKIGYRLAKSDLNLHYKHFDSLRVARYIPDSLLKENDLIAISTFLDSVFMPKAGVKKPIVVPKNKYLRKI